MLHEQVQEELFHSECIRYISRHLSQDGTKGVSGSGGQDGVKGVNGSVGALLKPPVGSGSKDTMLVLKPPTVDTKLVEISLSSWLDPHSLTYSIELRTHTNNYKGWIQ